MVSPLQGAIAAKVGRAFASTFYNATVSRDIPGTPDPLTPYIQPDPTTVTYSCKGMVDEFSDYAIANRLVDAQDRKVLILATSLSIKPTDGDRVTIKGPTDPAAVTYRIVPPVKVDPAGAVWELRCKV